MVRHQGLCCHHITVGMVKLKTLRKRLLNMLYLWVVSHHCLNGFTYVEFLNLFSSRPI
jgi:hypothetical protein